MQISIIIRKSAVKQFNNEPIVESGAIAVNSDRNREEPDVVEVDGVALRNRGFPETDAALT
ncbi:hypothetical protein [Gloeocapsopsis sp. IPPAS B-1203]|uniref:hypothetical protein n=1 Tax=Gloeocapsopsis sp. IPPAS B-1203 TaxID=2049454 RepID=UPI000C18E8C1|nr:hypothetical protein [Gloeocapsopsis sp. IPPAS B-1203]PIG92195.1 hypothetical protein CSQ79_16285 [Gloeocapsopsis sp. IPPAS B-1203]